MKGQVREWKERGGGDLFVGGLSKYFGVQRESLNITNVREGSVIVDYEVVVKKSRKKEIEALQKRLPEVKGIDLGAPLEVEREEPPTASFFNSVRSRKTLPPKEEQQTPASKSSSKPIQPYRKLIQAFNSGTSPKSS